jgi:hypothetical protein
MAATPVCDTTRNACVACLTDANCAGRTAPGVGDAAGVPTPVCQTGVGGVGNRCVECVNLADGGIDGCGAGMRCVAGIGGARCM